MTFKGKTLVSTVLLAGLLALGAQTGFAASGSDGGGGSGSGSSSSSSYGGGGNGNSGNGGPSACQVGYVWNVAAGMCQRVSVSKADDKTLYTQGRALALAGKYAQAITMLKAVRHPDAMTYTMLGFSERKSGNFDRALAYYAEALDIEPNNVNAHEYLGEAYVEQGKIDLAKAELLKVKAVCGTGCEPYRDLLSFINGGPGAS